MTLTLTESTWIDASRVFEGSVLAYSFNSSTAFPGPELSQTEVSRLESIELKEEGGEMRLGSVVRLQKRLIFSRFNATDFQLWEIEENALKSLGQIKQKEGSVILGAVFLSQNNTLYALYWTRRDISTHEIYIVDTTWEQHFSSPPALTIEHFSTITVTICNSELFIAASNPAESPLLTALLLYQYKLTSRSFLLKTETITNQSEFRITEAKCQGFLVIAIDTQLGLVRGHFPLLLDFTTYQTDRIQNYDDTPQSLLVSEYSSLIATLTLDGMVLYSDGIQALDFISWSRFQSVPVSIVLVQQFVLLIVETESKLWVVVYNTGAQYMYSVPLFSLPNGTHFQSFQLMWELSECMQNCLLLVMIGDKVNRYGVKVREMEIQVTGLAEEYTIQLCARELFLTENVICSKAVIDTLQVDDVNVYKGNGYAVERTNSSDLIIDVLVDSNSIETNLKLGDYFSGSNLHYVLELDQTSPGLTVQDTSPQSDLLLVSSRKLSLDGQVNCHARNRELMVYVTLGNREIRVFGDVETVVKVHFQPLFCVMSELDYLYVYHEDDGTAFFTEIMLFNDISISYPAVHTCKQLILWKFLWCISPLRYSKYDLSQMTLLEDHNNETVLDITFNSISMVVLHDAGVLDMYSDARIDSKLQYQVNETIGKIWHISDYLLGISSSGDVFIYRISRNLQLSAQFHFKQVCNDIRNLRETVLLVCGNTLHLLMLRAPMHESLQGSVLMRTDLLAVSDISDPKGLLFSTLECRDGLCLENTWKLSNRYIMSLEIKLTHPEFGDSDAIDLKGNLTLFNDKGGQHTARLVIRLLNSGFFPWVNQSHLCSNQTVPWTESFSLDVDRYIEGTNLNYSVLSNRTNFTRFFTVNQSYKTANLPWTYSSQALKDFDVSIELHLALLLQVSFIEFSKFDCDQDWNCSQSVECTIDLSKLGFQMPHKISIIDYSDSHLLFSVVGMGNAHQYDVYSSLDTFVVLSYSLAEKRISNWVASPKIILTRDMTSRLVSVKTQPGIYHVFSSSKWSRSELKHLIVKWDGQTDIVLDALTYDLDYLLFTNALAIHKEDNSTKVYIAHSYKGILQFQLQHQKLVLERTIPYSVLNLNEGIQSMGVIPKYLLFLTRSALWIYSLKDMKYVNKLMSDLYTQEIDVPSCVHCEGTVSYIVLRGYMGILFIRIIDGVPKTQVLKMHAKTVKFLTFHSGIVFGRYPQPFEYIELVHPTLYFPKQDAETESEEIVFRVEGSNAAGSVETCSFLLVRTVDHGTAYYVTCTGFLLILVLSVLWVIWRRLRSEGRKVAVTEESIEMSRVSTDN